jgi:anti-sigma factor RsiW
MTSRCADEEELLFLVDGELTENDAERLRSHVRSCGVCAARLAELERTLRELKAPPPELDSAALVETLMRQLPGAVADPSALNAPRRTARWALVGGGLAAVVALSALVVVPRALHPAIDEPSGLTARGAPLGTSTARGVGVSVLRPSVSRDPVAPGARVRVGDAYVVRYRNLLPDGVHLLAFAVDAAGAVHWISPAYLDPQTNPASVALAPSATETLLPPAMQLDAPASGPLRFVAILSHSPLRVLDVDTLRGADLSTESLRARWPVADVRELVTVYVDPSP